MQLSLLICIQMNSPLQVNYGLGFEYVWEKFPVMMRLYFEEIL